MGFANLQFEEEANEEYQENEGREFFSTREEAQSKEEEVKRTLDEIVERPGVSTKQLEAPEQKESG